MKIKVITRAAEDFTRERKSDVVKVFKNPDPVIHPFERAREFTRALNATKLDKVFAKPFARALAGHRDAVSCMARSRTRVVDIASGSCDGEVRIWDLATGSSRWSAMAHSGFVRGVAWVPDGDSLWTCGDDRLIKLWQRDPEVDEGETVQPDLTIMGQHAFLGLDVHWKENLIATCGVDVQIWDPHRSEPVHVLTWGSDSVLSVKFNAIERNVIASTGSDRSIVLHDMRAVALARRGDVSRHLRPAPLHALLLELETAARARRKQRHPGTPHWASGERRLSAERAIRLYLVVVTKFAGGTRERRKLSK